MFRKICNYLAVFALSLMVTGNIALANPTASNAKKEVKTVAVDSSKDFNYYVEFIKSGGRHSYNVKVEPGKEVKVRIRSSKGISLNIQKHNGETQNYQNEKVFDVRLRAEGEYVLELESLFISQYSIEILND